MKTFFKKIKESEVYGFLTDGVTDISNICQLVSFVKYFDIDKGQADTVFFDCSDLLSYSTSSSPMLTLWLCVYLRSLKNSILKK